MTSIDEVADRQLCLGCGACAFVQPGDISMVDDPRHGSRPRVRVEDGRPVDTTEALEVCPGIELYRVKSEWDDGYIPELADAWGPILEIWEGYAADDQVRFAGSSGGAASALALHCLAHEGMAGLLHIAAREDVPYLNRTVLSTTREEILAATGSRYAPASPCERLDLIENADGPCVFIGKPCDVAGAQRARRTRPQLDKNLGLTIAIFCAGTPSTAGTLEMISRMGVDDSSKVESVRYRGKGWPGTAEVRYREGSETKTERMSYDESWGEILQRHRPWRCYICPDHTGEFADVTVGDPWYRPIAADEAGRSLVIPRTARGRELMHRAMAQGALTLEERDPGTLLASQPNLLAARGAAWGRLTGGRISGLKAPRYRKMATLRVWLRELSLRAKLRSVLSTLRRRLRGELPRKLDAAEK